MANFEWFTRAHRWVYDRSGGRIGGNLGGRPMVLMYTRGARTGLPRLVPLQYYPVDPAGILVLASNNGQPRPPAWYHNLKACPEIDILVGRERRRVRAEEISAERKAELWPEMRRRNPAIDAYAARSGRDLPVILLRTLRP
jgi:deazaflavin-dependent oxidoreductase (nitroreductase family)